MRIEDLLAAIRARAANPATRTDYAESRPLELARPATQDDVEVAEAKMGCRIHPLHVTLLSQVANGGFGPGDGFVGVRNGVPDASGLLLPELRETLWLDSETPLPQAVVPLLDWGDGIWSCVDAETGAVLTLDECGLKDIGRGFQDWLEDWASGVSLWDHLVTVEEREIVDPFAKEKRKVKLVTGTRGTPYIPRPK